MTLKHHDSGLSSSRNYSTTIKEKSERFVSTEHDSDYGYTSRFRPIEKNAIGASAIIVQDIPDGVLGRPVEFES